MPPPLVSIVTPSYNQGAYLEETMLSVLEQDYPALEYLVVDGGSTDESVEVIGRYADRLAWWTSEPDSGQSEALNKGFARARGKYLGWLCADDTLLPGAISRLVEELERDPALVLAYGDAYFSDERSTRKDYFPSAEWSSDYMLRTGWTAPRQQASLWPRSSWEAAGPLSESLHVYMDLEFFLRLSALGQAVHISEGLATYRIHTAAKSTGEPLRKAEDAVRVAEQVMTSERLPEPLGRQARRGRSTMYRRAGVDFYAALDLARARKCLLRALVLDPRGAAGEAVAPLVKSLLPSPLVRRLRARRVATYQSSSE
jgi:glycosyltransferase involved in cell wall biosynthesis